MLISGEYYILRQKAVIDSVNRGETSAILTPLTLIEIFYVAERIYQEVHAQQQSEILAKKLYDFVYYHHM